jgi:hypothetical protein
VEKARTLEVTQKQRYPGSLMEDWHKSTGLVQSDKKGYSGASVQANRNLKKERPVSEQGFLLGLLEFAFAMSKPFFTSIII